MRRGGRRLGVVLLAAAALVPAAPATAAWTHRNPRQQPFASTSIWNMPIGTHARYVRANIVTDPRGDPWASMPQNDVNSIVFTPQAPLTEVYYSDARWSGRSRCARTGTSRFYAVPMPRTYVVPSDPENEGAAYLMPDDRTVNISVPLARCRAGGYATSIDASAPIDLYGDGRGGVGGSGLAGNPGGVLRLGELRPGQTGPRHALRIVLDAAQDLYRCRTPRACYRWPASRADGYAVGYYGTIGDNQNTAMKMGVLLAIPQTVSLASIGLETEPARELAWTLQNYGAYVTDDTYGPAVNIVTERGPDGWFADELEADPPGAPPLAATQFYDDYGFPFEARVNTDSAWSRDLQRLLGALWVVANNTPSTIGGGGTPLQPLAPPISPTAVARS